MSSSQTSESLTEGMDRQAQVNTRTTTQSRGAGSLIAVIVLLIFLGAIIFLIYYLRQKNRSNRPPAIITNFGSTLTSEKNGRLLSLERILSGTFDDPIVVNAKGFRDPATKAVDVDCGWILRSSQPNSTMKNLSLGTVTIQNAFTQNYCSVGVNFDGTLILLCETIETPADPSTAPSLWFNLKTLPLQQATTKKTSSQDPAASGKDSTATLITLESYSNKGKFIIANPNGTVVVGSTTPNSDFMFMVGN